ncbi:MAG: hypothetical protein DRO06_03330 [Thermoproteota archaeon]|nr:MAG: hypothetical protein DRO06_03330 [Candidatus Korarchaeota archaeon]
MTKAELESGYEALYRAAVAAASAGGVRALLSLAPESKYAVARAVEEFFGEALIEAVERDPMAGVALYRQIRWQMREDLRRVFRSVLVKSILRGTALVRRGRARGRTRYAGEYEPGDDFDLEATIERLLESGKRPSELSYEDVVAIKRGRKVESAVLILDTSGSMSGKKIATAAVLTAVTANLLSGGEVAVIAFNTEPVVLKGADEEVNVEELVGEILDLSPVGYTNLRAALEMAASEAGRMKSRRRVFILVTDGLYNVGGDPRPAASRLRGLRIFRVPGRGVWSPVGERICKELSLVSDGSLTTVERVWDIPRVLRKILPG